MEEYLNVEDLMRILKVSRTTAYACLRSPRLKSFKVGKLVRIKAADLQRFIEGRPARPNK